MSKTMTRSNAIVCSNIFDERFEKGLKRAGGAGAARRCRSLVVKPVIKDEQLVGNGGKVLGNPQVVTSALNYPRAMNVYLLTRFVQARAARAFPVNFYITRSPRILVENFDTTEAAGTDKIGWSVRPGGNHGNQLRGRVLLSASQGLWMPTTELVGYLP
jgi:hypothetical protein